MAIFGDYQELVTMPAIKGALAAVLSWKLNAVGYPDSAIVALLYLLVADFFLGFARAWKSGDVRGSKIRQGAFKFFRYGLAVALFGWVDQAVGVAIPVIPMTLRDMFIAYLAINEVFSCWDHLAFFGMPMPEPIRKRLIHYRDVIAAVPGERKESGGQ